MNRLLHRAAIVPALLVLLLAGGCTRPLKERVVGTWKEASGNWQVSFLKDGTFTSSGTPKGLFGGGKPAVPSGAGDIGAQLQGLVSQALSNVRIAGSYTTPDEKTLKLQPEGPASMLGPQVWPVEVKGKTLLVDLNGKKTEFTKMD